MLGRQLSRIMAPAFRPFAAARWYSVTPALHESAEFKEASERVKTASSEPDIPTKLKLYALFKQATTGANTTPKPGMMDFVVCSSLSFPCLNVIPAVSCAFRGQRVLAVS